MAHSEPIPVLDLSPEIAACRAELVRAFEAVLDGRQFILGPEVRAFEQEVASHLGAAHAIGVNSGTDALVISLRALDIGPGDEVVTTPFTFFATAEAIAIVGASPVFVDIDPLTYAMDPSLVESGMTERTKAILPVHLFGHAAAMEDLMRIARERNVCVVEDAAQAFGGRFNDESVGTIGTLGAYSFFPSKNLGAFGDGGLITTNSDTLAERVRSLRAHGGRRKYQNEELGYNSRLDELQAALLRVKLRHIDNANSGRRRVAAAYGTLLADLDGVVLPSTKQTVTHVYHQYTVRITGGRRDEVAASLAKKAIATMVYYPVPVHLLPVFASQYATGDYPVAEQAAGEVLSLPIWPTMHDSVIERVATSLRNAVG